MNLYEVEQFSRETVKEHAFMYPEQLAGWSFAWDNTRNALGRCVYTPKEVRLSRWLVPAVKDEAKIIDTLLHELAHALAGSSHGHDSTWKNWCVKIGANPERCYNQAAVLDVGKLQYKYKHYCPECLVEGGHSRAWKRAKACVTCCKKYSGGVFSDRFQLIELRNY